MTIILLSCLGGIVYSHSFENSFHFDDFPTIVNNISIKNIHQVNRIWAFWPTRFISYLSFALNYHWGGLNVLGYHIFNLLIHVGTALLVWWLMMLISDSALVSFFTATVFLVHPLQTQTVNYIFQRCTLLAAFFYLSSLTLYIKSVQSQKKVYYIGSLLAAILSMFSKETAISLPFMICFYEFYFLKSRCWQRLMPFLITVLIIPYTWHLSNPIHFVAMKKTVEGYAGGVTVQQYFLTELRVMVTYVRMLFIPAYQTIDYDYPLSKSLFEMPVILNSLVLFFIVGGALRLKNTNKLAAFGIFWFFMTLMPESSIWPNLDVIFEHRLYLPLAGYSIFLTSALFYCLKNKTPWVIVILSVLSIVYSLLAYHRNNVWKNEFTLWNEAVHRSPAKARPYLNRGSAYLNNGVLDLALADFNKAIAIDSTDAIVYSNRGLVYEKKGDLDQAILNFSQAIAINHYIGAYANRGVAYGNKGELNKSLSDFNYIIERDPNYNVAVYINRGTIYQKKGQLDQALSDYNKAIAAGTHDPIVYNNRGVIFENRKDFDRAIADLNQAIALKPNFAGFYSNRGLMWGKKGDYDRAISDFTHTLSLQPDNADVYTNRGVAYEHKGNMKEALANYNKALEIDPKFTDALNNRNHLLQTKR